MRVLAVLILFALVSLAPAQVVQLDMLTLMDGQLLLSNGATTSTWGYAYEDDPILDLPSPLLLFNEGDSVNISIYNPSAEGHTIHLHGLDVDQANDGVPQTSFFVPFGGSTTYSFRASKTGTYLYHCHVTTTLHLTMGMYGMIVVERPDLTLYEGGPSYDDSFYFLASDLEIATNDNSILAYPFHEISPDYFMVNGKSGAMLFEGTENMIEVAAGETVALRLGSMAYARTEYIFPASANATIHMSDGRALPQSLSVDTLEIYPGERYTVLLQPEEDIADYMYVDYYSMENGIYQWTNAVGINSSTYPLGIEEQSATGLSIYPNPTSGPSTVTGLSGSTLDITDSSGRVLWRIPVQNGKAMIDMSGYPAGIYYLRDEQGAHRLLRIGS